MVVLTVSPCVVRFRRFDEDNRIVGRSKGTKRSARERSIDCRRTGTGFVFALAEAGLAGKGGRRNSRAGVLARGNENRVRCCDAFALCLSDSSVVCRVRDGYSRFRLVEMLKSSLFLQYR